MVGAIGDNSNGASLAGMAGVTGSVDAAAQARQTDFASVIARSKNAAGRDHKQAAREAAEQFVASALVQPILAQLRSTNWAAAPFAPTSGERTFQQMADAQTAIGLVRRTKWTIVDRIAESIERRGAPRVKP
jgi:Rod binding domain-containing protein